MHIKYFRELSSSISAFDVAAAAYSAPLHSTLSDGCKLYLYAFVFTNTSGSFSRCLISDSFKSSLFYNLQL